MSMGSVPAAYCLRVPDGCLHDDGTNVMHINAEQRCEITELLRSEGRKRNIVCEIFFQIVLLISLLDLKCHDCHMFLPL
jgi:hypothetical protein